MRTELLSPSFWNLQSRGFALLLAQHIRVYWLTYLLLAALAVQLRANYYIGVNESASLPQTFFVVRYGDAVKKGDYVAFRVPEAAKRHFTNPNAVLMKVIVGAAGDRVVVKGRVVFLNGVPVAFAKPRSIKGEELEPMHDLVLGPDQFFVLGLHRDSLDSRYEMIGFITRADVVGRAHPLF